jgi:radical SAM superfamily enzyme YgiQ (UPF0313 family)
MNRTLILVNPWVYDFAAYDLWSKPLGLLDLAGCLRARGFEIRFIDCLDVHHPGMRHPHGAEAPRRRLFGTGKFFREQVSKPLALGHVPRTYSRYGMAPDLVEQELRRVSAPSAVLVTSLMTYWYPGVQGVIELARKAHPGVPVVLGGIYARLCESHARTHSGADLVSTAEGADAVPKLLGDLGIPVPEMRPDLPFQPYPAFDLLTRLDYICLLTSVGCPYRCRYCASRFLNPRGERRPASDVVEEVLFWRRCFGVRDFAFYDDALLAQGREHAAPILKALMGQAPDLRFHTPNALHVKEVTADMARLLRRTGFRTIRLGLETADAALHEVMDKKVSAGDFERGVDHLRAAGYESREIGAYILAGLPGQTVDSVFQTLEYVQEVGAVPYLSEYSPIPHTPMWQEAVLHSELDLASEPLFHNNTLMPCWDESQRQRLPELKKRTLEIRRRFRGEAV